MGFCNTQDVLLSLLSKALFQKPSDIDTDIDFEALYKESAQQTVSSLVFTALPKGIKSDVIKKWELEFNMDLLFYSKLSFAHTQIHTLMSNADIPYVILKGCVSASYYKDPMLRKSGDVDFLVRECDYVKAQKLLLENGFLCTDTHHEYEMSFEKNGIVFELHRKINGIPDNKSSEKFQRLFDDIFDNAVLLKNDFYEFIAPDKFCHGLIMLLHIARHMLTGGIGLRHLCDWAVFVDSIKDDFETIFKEKLRSVGLWKFAQILCALSVKYLGCPQIPFAEDVDKDLLSALKNDIFEGGNFGHKDLNRADEAKFITSRKDGGVSKKSNFMQAVISANEIVRRHWKFADKCPLVYPFGWLFFGARYGVRTIFKKREKKNINALIKGADKRKEIYKEIELFIEG